MENAIIAQLGDEVGLRKQIKRAPFAGDLTQYPEQGNKKEEREKERKGEKIHKMESSVENLRERKKNKAENSVEYVRDEKK